MTFARKILELSAPSSFIVSILDHSSFLLISYLCDGNCPRLLRTHKFDAKQRPVVGGITAWEVDSRLLTATQAAHLAFLSRLPWALAKQERQGCPVQSFHPQPNLLKL